MDWMPLTTLCPICSKDGKSSRLQQRFAQDTGEVKCTAGHSFSSLAVAMEGQFSDVAVQPIQEAQAPAKVAPAEVSALPGQSVPESLKTPVMAFEPPPVFELNPVILEPIAKAENEKAFGHLPAMTLKPGDVLEVVDVEELEDRVSPANPLYRPAAERPQGLTAKEIVEKYHESMAKAAVAVLEPTAELDQETKDLYVRVRIPEQHVSALSAEAENQKEEVAVFLQRMIEFGLDARWFF